MEDRKWQIKTNQLKNTESTVEETNVKQNIDDSVEQAEESKGHLQDEAIEETSDENVIEEIDPKDQKLMNFNN